MANRLNEPQPGDVADEHGRFVPEALDDRVTDPVATEDPAAGRGSTGAGGPAPPGGAPDVAIGGLGDPDADANHPDPSRPIVMATGADRGAPQGGYGDSRDVGGRPTPPVNDDDAGGPPADDGEVASGSHLSEDDTRGTPPGSEDPAEHPRVSQPANVPRPRDP